MKNIYLGFKFVLSYFTILPVSFKKDDDLSSKEVLASTLFFLPLVGLLLSTLTIFIYQQFEPVWFNALLFSTIYMFLYGFIHTEAISDVIDALYAAHSNKDAYEVIKEPTIGAMGMLYSVALVVLKLAAITYILLEQYFLEFVVITMISRFTLLYIIKFNEFKSSFVDALKKGFNNKILTIAFIVYSCIGFVLLKSEFFIYLFAAIFIGIVVTNYLKRKLGFINGDVLGFNVEIIEIISMIVLIQFIV